MNNKVEALGSFWEATAPYVAMAEKAEKEKKEKKRKVIQLNNLVLNEEREEHKELVFDYENAQNVVDQLNDIIKLLKKADINLKLFPFKPQKNKEGEIVGFIPKGKNEKEIKENIKKYKEELEKALQSGKITQEEFDKLNENLEKLMEENDIKLEEEKEFELSDDDVEKNLEGLIIHNFGDEYEFEKFCKKYESMDLNGRKECLEDFNSKINVQLGIAGDLKFSNNPKLKFENSFYDDGYYLTEKQVETQDLKPMLYTMMEKSMIRQIEIKNQQKISAQKKKEMHQKIMEERERKYKKYKEKQDRKNGEKVRSRIRNLYGN